MCGSRPSTPEIPDPAPRRAAERLPNRGTVEGSARRRVEATQGRMMQGTILGSLRSVARRRAGGAARGTSSGGEISTQLGG